MPTGTAPIFRLIEEPYWRKSTTKAFPDDWAWKEGRPTPIASPLVSKNIHPWGYARVYAKPLVEPKYSISHQGTPYQDSLVSPFRYTSFTPINRPDFISDHHVISLRRQIESLWSPKIAAHIHLDVDGEIIVNALYQVKHRVIAEASTFGYSQFGDATNRRVFAFGEGGTLVGGHGHVWGAGGGGSVLWSAKLCLDHGGAIGESRGNYEIIEEPTYSYTVTKWYRQVFSQDSGRHFSLDIDALTQWWQKMVPTTFNYDEVMGYCLDAGALWLHPGNTRPCSSCEDGIMLILDGQHTYGFTACTLVDRENQLRPWFVNGRTHVPTEAPVIGTKLSHNWMEAWDPGVTVNLAIRYWHETKTYTGTGYSFEVPRIFGDCGTTAAPQGEPDPSGGDQWIKNCIGTRVVPTWYLTIRDMNGNVSRPIITETEFPNSNI